MILEITCGWTQIPRAFLRWLKKYMAAMLIAKRSASAAPEVNLRIPSCTGYEAHKIPG